MKKIQRLIGIALIGITIFTYGCSKKEVVKPEGNLDPDRASGEQKIEKPEIGYLAPDFAITDLGGKELKLSSFRGEQVLLTFWTSWCSFCIEEMPDLQSLHEDGRIKIVTVNLTYGERSVEKMREFIEVGKYSFPVGMDLSGKVGQLYGVRSIPVSFLLDREGIIQGIYNEPLTREVVEQQFLEID